MRAFFEEFPSVSGFTGACGRRTVKVGDRTITKPTCNIILYSKSAELSVLANQKKLLLAPGSTLLLSAESENSFTCLQDGELVVIGYQTIAPLQSSEPLLLTTASPKRTRQVFEQFLHATEEQKPLRELAMRSAFYTLLYLLARNSKIGNRLFLKESLLREARAYLDRHYADPHLRVTSAAEKAGISPAYLRRLFLELEGCTPIEYVNRIRIRQAKKMISEGALSFEKIVHACGLSDPSYLKKLLKSAESTEKSK